MVSKKKFAILLPLVVPAVVFAGLSYDGSSTIGETIMPEITVAFKAKTGIAFDKISLIGSGKGFAAVMAGSVDVAGVSRSLLPDEKKLKPYYQTIGYDAIAVFINDKNPVKDLSGDQVAGIFSGSITNWKEVGGQDAKITLVTEVKTGDRATIKAFRELAMENGELGKSKEIDKPHDCVTYVAADENAITFASLAFKVKGAKVLSLNGIDAQPKNVKSGAYFLSRPLLLVTKGLPQGDVKKFMDFMLSPEGQIVVGKHFVPVK